MSRDAYILFILLLITLAVALIYLIIHLRNKDRKKGVVNFVTFLVFPIVGFAYMGISELVNLILYRKNKKEISYEDLSFDKRRMKLVQDPDVEKSLRAALAKIKPETARSSAEAQKIFERQFAQVIREIQPLIDHINKKIAEKNYIIDTPESYAKTTALCKKW